VNKEKVRPLTDEDLDGVAGGLSGVKGPSAVAITIFVTNPNRGSEKNLSQGRNIGLSEVANTGTPTAPLSRA
jgi:hypothetical protein